VEQSSELLDIWERNYRELLDKALQLTEHSYAPRRAGLRHFEGANMASNVVPFELIREDYRRVSSLIGPHVPDGIVDEAVGALSNILQARDSVKQRFDDASDGVRRIPLTLNADYPVLPLSHLGISLSDLRASTAKRRGLVDGLKTRNKLG
jgi:hypothetical protein